MTNTPLEDGDDAERAANRQADAMKDRLREEAAAWRSARFDAPARDIAPVPPVAPVARSAAAKPASTAKAKAAAAARAAAPAVVEPKKPFGMKYDGVSNADHMRYLFNRGAR